VPSLEDCLRTPPARLLGLLVPSALAASTGPRAKGRFPKPRLAQGPIREGGTVSVGTSVEPQVSVHAAAGDRG